MALPVSPAFALSGTDYFSTTVQDNAPAITTQRYNLTSYSRSSSPRPTLRPRTDSRSTSLRSLALSYADNNPAAIRSQRQRAVRDQCSSSHLREISELVQRMIDNEDQCSVSSVNLTPATSTFRSRQNSDATTESVASSLSGPAFEEEGYASDIDAVAEDAMDDTVDDCGSELDYRRSTDWLAGRMARCSVGKDVRVRKHRRRH